MPETSPIVLCVGGSDPSGGAGIEADVKAAHAAGAHACTAVTALTVQNTQGVNAVHPTPTGILEATLRSILGDMPVRVVKTGLLASAEQIQCLARILGNYPDIELIVDPVLGPTSGRPFLDNDGIDTLREHLLPRASLVTPNLDELARLTGLPTTDRTSRITALRAFVQNGPAQAALAKGGHCPEEPAGDDYLDAKGNLLHFPGHYIQTPNTHGTGCTLASAIAGHRASGDSYPDAIRKAKNQLETHLRQNARFRYGPGRGPAQGPEF